MKCLLTHPTGNNFVREAAIALHEAGFLYELHLSMAACGDNWVSKLGKLPGMKEITRRTYPAELSDALYLHPWREIFRLIAGRMGINQLTAHEYGYASTDACYRAIDSAVANHLSKSSPDIVYAYEDGALHSFRRAKELNIRRIYDLPIAHWKTSRRIMEEEAERLPEWGPTLTAIHDSDQKCARKDEELELAECIICPSRFVADSIPRTIAASKQVHIIPFGSPENIAPRETNRLKDPKLRVLFAGSMSQRKGLADLMAAMNQLDPDHFELNVMGSLLAPMEFYRKQCPNFIYHEPRPHSEVLELMQQFDVFALPSLVEGRALVQQEALACGLPIIVTKNAGAEDLVQDNKAGFLIPIRSPEAIAEKLRLLQCNPDLLKEMQKAAPVRAAQVSWAAYRDEIINAVSGI